MNSTNHDATPPAPEGDEVSASAVELLAFARHSNVDAPFIRVSLAPDSAADDLAQILADELVRRLGSPVLDIVLKRESHLGGTGPALNSSERAVLAAYVSADFSDGENATRIEGAVAEHLWASIAMSLDGDWGRPLVMEHDHFSVIDHGPDGLSIYDRHDEYHGFRLWESKRHASDDSITDTVTTAAGQLALNGTQYLARLSKVLQTNDDPDVRRLGGVLVRAWHEKWATSGVGVSLGRSAGGAIPDRPFIGLKRKFDLPDSGQLEGVLIEIPHFSEFAMRVRDRVLEGLH